MKFKCCFCGKEFEGYGNNPDCWDGKEWKAEDRCCDQCDQLIVIPNRIKAVIARDAAELKS